MRFLCYTQGDDTVPPPVPSPELMERMGEFVGEAMAAGKIVATGGFAPSATGTVLRLADGEYSITDGPYAEAKELIGGWALLEVESKEEVVEWCRRFLGVLGEGECAIRQTFGPEDMPADLSPQQLHNIQQGRGPA